MNRVVMKGVRAVRRVIVAVVGSTIVLVGLALVFLPGPAFVVIPIGLGILALEFTWAQRLLKRARAYYLQPRETETDASSEAASDEETGKGRDVRPGAP